TCPPHREPPLRTAPPQSSLSTHPPRRRQPPTPADTALLRQVRTMTFTRRQTLVALGAAAALPALTLRLSACGSPAEGEGTSLTVLQYQDPTSAQGQGWKRALEIFKEQHPDVTVDFQQTSFDAVRQNAKITLSGNEVPDVIEFNKGNADGGQLAAQG